MAKLVVLSGVPGSGKSFFAMTARNYKKQHLYIVSSDELRNQVTGNQQNLNSDKLVWKLFYGFAKVYSMDPEGIVILDATNSVCKYRVSIIEPFKKFFSSIVLVAFDLDKETVIKQNKERDFPIPDEALLTLIQNYEKPNQIDYDFFDEIFTIKDHNILPIIEKL